MLYKTVIPDDFASPLQVMVIHF